MPKCRDCLFYYEFDCLSSRGISKGKCNPDQDVSDCHGFVDKRNCKNKDLSRRAGQFIRE